MSGVRPAASARFARSPSTYERARPDYSPAAVEFLAARLGLGPGRTVLDLAAGTGKLTRPLLATGAEVVAVEPVAEMRAGLPAAARVLDGTAEAIPLAAGGADAVTVGQAFHWFDGEPALAEIHRVLRPGGALGLIWNRRRRDDALSRALDELMAPYRPDARGHRGDDWRAAFERTALFGPLEERRFANDQSVDADGLADRFGSVSYIAALDEGRRAEFLAAVRALAGTGRVTVRYETEVQVCERVGAGPGRCAPSGGRT
jgi:SAM-dependent methyltransferase